MLRVESVASGAGARCAVQSDAIGGVRPPFPGPAMEGPRVGCRDTVWKMSSRSLPPEPLATTGPNCPADHSAAVPGYAGQRPSA
eukprot:11947371-Alexandrium_andersonii.AAC.1